jgi:hypothetical protein
MIGRSQGHLAAMAGVLAFGACSDPDEQSDLRSDGPPEVLTVLAANDAPSRGIRERATFCKVGDDKRPGYVPSVPMPIGPQQICPDDLSKDVDEATDTVPFGWYVRIVFDELLDGDVEELIPIKDNHGGNTGLFAGSLARTQPVTLSCGGVDIPYDGYYDVSGNPESWPLAPSLFIQPLMFNNPSAPKAPPPFTVPSGTECEVALKPDVVTDKDGNKVPSTQLGPYKFRLAPMTLVAETPAAPKDPTMPVTIKATTPMVLSFNAPIKDDSITADKVTITEVESCSSTTGIVHPAVVSLDADNHQVLDVTEADAAGDDAWLHSKTFTITFNAGATVQDAAGGVGTLPGAGTLTLCFKTDG